MTGGPTWVSGMAYLFALGFDLHAVWQKTPGVWMATDLPSLSGWMCSSRGEARRPSSSAVMSFSQWMKK